MKKNILNILILIILIGIFSPVTYVKAVACTGTNTPPGCTNGTSSPYTLLAPLPCPPDSVGCDHGQLKTFDPASADSSDKLSDYLNIMIKIIIGISAVLAVVMIVMGGIEYMGSELISSKEAGKERIQNAILGLLIALGAYALLNTINPNLLNSKIEIKDATVVVEISDNVPQTAVGGKFSDGRIEGTAITGQITSLPNGIILSPDTRECTTVGQQSCTSTSRLIIAPLIKLRDNCNCALVLTGGTETWLHGGGGHGTTHGVGSGTVDLRISSDLNKYFTGSTTTPEKKWYQTPSGYALYEGNHWHFNPAGPH